MAKRTDRPSNGQKIYDDGQIIAILTGLEKPSKNIKTGDMLQLWILVADTDPISAQQLFKDELICGTCPLKGPVCYVTLFQAPLNVWRTYHDLPVQPVPDTLRAPVRLGAYGDPAFLPVALLETLTHGTRHTGYTHQWATPNQPNIAEFVMASIDPLDARRQGLTTLGLKRKAQALGYRTFRVLPDKDAPLDSDEILCPNYTRSVQCADCGLCSGAGGAKNIAIPAHGAGASALG